jgi:formylglycine-generating enzyme required for sulfatase activity
MSSRVLFRLSLVVSLTFFVLLLGCGKRPKDVDADRDGGIKDARGADKGKAEDGGTGGDRHALVVGVASYDNAAFGTLKYTENDAEGLAEALQKPEAGFRVRVLTGSRGRQDKQDAPTAANVKKAIGELLAKRKRGDVVLIAFAGHGVTLELKDPDGKGEPKTYPYFCAADADLLDPRYSTGESDTMVNLDELFSRLGRCGAGTKLVLMDACRNQLTVKAGRRSLSGDGTSIPVGVAALYSCGRGQFAYETDKLGKGHGVFFYQAIEGLKGKAKDDEGVVTWASLTGYVTRQTSREVPKIIGGGAVQHPAALGSLEGESPILVMKQGKTPQKDGSAVVLSDKDKDKGETRVDADKGEKEFVNSLKMKFVRIPAGKFLMGTSSEEKWRDVDEHQHEVTITRPFFMGATEVTQMQWMKLYGTKNNPSSYVGGTGHLKGVDTDDFPVETVSWNDAVKFCEKLSALPDEKKAGRVYRLPTEAEWEYACRAGSTTLYHFGDEFDQAKANCGDSIPGLTESTTKRKPNKWGLHDVHGNVAEWCSDWYDQRYYKDGPGQDKDPKGPEEGTLRVIRGGHATSIHDNFLLRARLLCRSAARASSKPETKSQFVGFRVVCEVK